MKKNVTPNNHKASPLSINRHHLTVLITVSILAVGMYACNSSAGSPNGLPPLQALPVITLANQGATTYQVFNASLEGSKDIEIRPQVDGYLEKIYVDEGAHVRKGQLLFQINERPYREQLNSAKASLAAAKANLTNAEINVSKLTPLVENNVVSNVQLQSAKASQAAAAAVVQQAQATVSNASIHVGYAFIKAPVDGYIGRIPFKSGSLVGATTATALTVISELNDVHAYFSLSETDFLKFEGQFQGKSVEDKIKNLPAVDLLLADGTIYSEKGKVELASGQFNNTMGAITFRATFKNTDGLLRSGNTGTIRIPQSLGNTLVVPQEATFELQDKVFVFVVSDSNKVTSTPITISGSSGNYYLVQKGLTPGQKIVYSGLDRLKDGSFIKPEQLSLDSLIKSRPL